MEELQLLMDSIQKLLPGIKFTMETSLVEISFLDTTVFKHGNPHTGYVLKTRIHQKALNKYLYVPYTSAHNNNTKRGFIKGELIRACRLCSLEEDFNTFRRLFRDRLMQRGYPRSYVNKVYITINYENRMQYLQPPEKSPGSNLIFKTRSCQRQRDMKIGSTLNVLPYYTTGFGPNVKPLVSLKSGTLLRKYFCRNPTGYKLEFNPSNSQWTVKPDKSSPTTESNYAARAANFPPDIITDFEFDMKSEFIW
jgi:hypothetical protein